MPVAGAAHWHIRRARRNPLVIIRKASRDHMPGSFAGGRSTRPFPVPRTDGAICYLTRVAAAACYQFDQRQEE